MMLKPIWSNSRGWFDFKISSQKANYLNYLLYLYYDNTFNKRHTTH